MDPKFERNPTIQEIDLEEGGILPNSSPATKPSEKVPRKHDHKDGLHRYAIVDDQNRDKDHYLQADDGKLQVLRVQEVPNHRVQEGLTTLWERPEDVNPLKSMWRGFRNSPRHIITWTFNDSLKGKTKNLEYGLCTGSFLEIATLSYFWLLKLTRCLYL